MARKPLIVPLRPLANRVLAWRRLQLAPLAPPPWSGFEASIYARLTPGTITTIFDVGANVGQSAEALVAAFPGARVLCFEPAPETFSALANNPRLKDKNVSVFNLALGSEAGAAQMLIEEGNNQLNKIAIPSRNGHEPVHKLVDVTVSTIEAVCAAEGINRIDLLKTDTEGHDLEVLKGARSMLGGRIGAVLCEVGFDRRDEQHTGFPEIFDLLRSYEFQFRGLYGIASNEAGVTEYANALFTRD